MHAQLDPGSNISLVPPGQTAFSGCVRLKIDLSGYPIDYQSIMPNKTHSLRFYSKNGFQPKQIFNIYIPGFKQKLIIITKWDSVHSTGIFSTINKCEKMVSSIESQIALLI